LPEECGVYYYYDKHGEVIYVGKSINIRLRAMQHFSERTEKTTKMLDGIYDITYEETGSELIALLLENHEIKRMKPRLNKAQKAKNFAYAVFYYKNENGYICFKASKNVVTTRSKLKLATEFQKLPDAKGRLRSYVQKLQLCSTLCDLESSEGACFSQQIGQCLGACIQSESPETYNERAQLAIDAMEVVFEKDFFIIEKGRNLQESAVVLIENNKFKGFGYIDNEAGSTFEDLYECILNYPNNPDALRIIRQYLSAGKNIKILNIDILK
jgi:DNA polymerase III subunit epsilon